MKPLSTTDILKLDHHRTRRHRRQRLAEAFHSLEPRREALVSHLTRIADVVRADRVSALWVDEYGAGIPHPHLVVDLLSDRPRRSFSREVLHTARESGVPGVVEVPGELATGRNAQGWGLVVSLGSDGTRSWFLTADSVVTRPGLSPRQRDDVMFLSGECSALVLHHDLSAGFEGDGLRTPRTDERRFPGWHVLRDLNGRDEESAEGRRIALRFVVARLPVLFVEDGLAVAADRRQEQVERVRQEIAGRGESFAPGGESVLWSRLLSAYESGDLPELAGSVLRLADHAATEGHLHGAGELLAAAFEIGVAAGDTETAVEAARAAGRTARRLGRWHDAHRWYETARRATLTLGWLGRAALVLDGVAATHRERGNLPAARTSLDEALVLAEESGEAQARGRVHHGFLGLEQASGNLDRAVQHGWRAVSLYEESGDRTRGLAGLAALFQEMGRLDAAEDAWLLVRHLSGEEYYTLYAVDALSHLAALRGDAATFARRAAESDAMGWESGPQGAKVEILLHRGLSHAALGRPDEARRWLERTMAFAEEAGFSRTLFEAEEALEALAGGEAEAVRPDQPAPPAPATTEVEEGLQAMRNELVGAATGRA